MLLGYGGKNCWAFREWMQINLEFNDNVPSDISLNLPSSTAMCFKGANASGKTNALKIFAFIVYFAKDSFDSNTEAEIPFDSYFNNDEPAEFYVEFIVGNNYFRYENILKKEKVISEKMFKKGLSKGSKERLIFERTENSVIGNAIYKKHSDIIFRKNVSFISLLHQYGIKEIDEIYNFFANTIINVNYQGLNDYSFKSPSVMSKLYSLNPHFLDFAKKKIHEFDTGIIDIKIEYKVNEKREMEYYPVFVHDTEMGECQLDVTKESSGTFALFCNLFLYCQAISTGGILVLDEFDINLHPDILPHLLDFFIVADNNPKSAQLIFTTHDKEIMDRAKKYRTYLFNKEKNESYCYRLDELQNGVLRNDRPISVPYSQHKIGGVPKIGSTEN